MKQEYLELLGYDEWFENHYQGKIREEFSIVRVVEVNKNSYKVSDGEKEMKAELAGKFLFNADDPADFPTAGDWVIAQVFENQSLAVVHDLMPRQTLLKRKGAGKRVDFQLIGANIDFGLMIQSADHPNFNLLDRYMVMLYESGIQPVAVFNKTDLLSPSELEHLKTVLMNQNQKYPYVIVSNQTENGLNPLLTHLKTGKTYCLLGPSGVGKTSMVNRLLGTEAFKVHEVREKDGKGRHTTVRRTLLRLDNGSILIDTPGMRELGNFYVDEGLEQTFDEFAEYSGKCRYKDCTHTHEEGCAVIQAVEDGTIDEQRYHNYLKIRKEADYYEMSYQEKRKKDKTFGKMVKNFKKQHGK